MDNQTVSSGGIGIGGLVFTILLILKIIGEVQLSWFVVITSFIWAPLLVSVVVLSIFGIFLVVLAAFVGLAEFIKRIK